MHNDPDSRAEWYQKLLDAKAEQVELGRKVKDREVESTEEDRVLCDSLNAASVARQKEKNKRIGVTKVDKSEGLYCCCETKNCKKRLKINVVDKIKLSKLEEMGKTYYFGFLSGKQVPVQTAYASGPKSGKVISVHETYEAAFADLLNLNLVEGKPKTTKHGEEVSFDEEATDTIGRKVRKGTPQIISLVDEGGKETSKVEISKYEIKRSATLFVVPMCEECKIDYTVEHLAKENEPWGFEEKLLNCVSRTKL